MIIDIYSLDIDKLYANTDLSSNMEDYIEAIAVLSQQNKVVRVKDIAALLKIKMPSVTSALDKLKELGLIDYEKYGYIELTESGNIISDRVISKHLCLKEFFSKILNLSEEQAEIEACKIEHHVTPETCKRIHKLLVYINTKESIKEEWLEFLSGGGL
ncbi:MAG: metal-dependent transcriptional regulator [Leptospirales bacterium]|nr:metal-dependent transcriptional regulator [Leptospirales bacterium]